MSLLVPKDPAVRRVRHEVLGEADIVREGVEEVRGARDTSRRQTQTQFVTTEVPFLRSARVSISLDKSALVPA